MEIVIRNAVDKGFHACHDDHDLNQIIRLMELQRFALLLGLDIGDAFGKALACAHFEINFDGTFTETDAWTGGDGRTFSLGATWEMATQRLPVDISGSGTAPLTWRQFAFHSVDTLPGSSCTLTTTTDGTTTKNTTVSAQLEMDLGPRETPPPGQPVPQPRASYLRLQPSPGGFDLESYHRQNSGCSSNGSDSTGFSWITELGDFHSGLR